ncbi:MAG: hypothetical protein WDO71_02410 [Bacteroidota bacterium]
MIAMKLTDILIFENDDFTVLNKPSGLLSIPDREGKEGFIKRFIAGKIRTDIYCSPA